MKISHDLHLSSMKLPVGAPGAKRARRGSIKKTVVIRQRKGSKAAAGSKNELAVST